MSSQLSIAYNNSRLSSDRHNLNSYDIGSIKPFNELNAEECGFVEEQIRKRSYRCGDIISEEQEGNVLCLRTGKMVLYKTASNGDNIVESMYGEKDVIGADSVIGSQSNPCGYKLVAISDCDCLLIPKEVVLHVLMSNSNFSFKFMQMMIRKNESVKDHLFVLLKRTMPGRLANVLLLLADVYGINRDDASLDVQLRRTDLADMANMTAENVVKVLRLFETEELVKLAGRKISILDRAKLEWRISVS